MAPGPRPRFPGVRAGWLALALGVSLAVTAAPGLAKPKKWRKPPTSPAPSAAPSTPATSSAAPPPAVSSTVLPASPASSAPAAAPAKETPAKEKEPAADGRDRQARALELHDEAKVLYDRGLYRRAIAKLEAAIELDPEGKELVYNLALIHEKLAEADVAERYYLRYIDMETDAKARERAVAIVKRLQGAKKNLEADIAERAAAASVSARPVVSAPPAEPPPRAAPMPSPMVLVVGGVAVVAVGVGVGFGISALATHPGSATTGPDLTAYELETRARSAHTHAVIADLALVTSLVVGSAATVLYLLETRAAGRAPTAAPPASPTRVSSSHVLPSLAIPPLRIEAPF